MKGEKSNIKKDLAHSLFVTSVRRKRRRKKREKKRKRKRREKSHNGLSRKNCRPNGSSFN